MEAVMEPRRERNAKKRRLPVEASGPFRVVVVRTPFDSPSLDRPTTD